MGRRLVQDGKISVGLSTSAFKICVQRFTVNVLYRERLVIYGLRDRSEVHSAVCSLQSAVCSLQSAVCGLQSAVCGLQIGSLSKPQRQRQRHRRQTKHLMSKTMAVHVRYKSLYISLPSSAQQRREMTTFWVF